MAKKSPTRLLLELVGILVITCVAIFFGNKFSKQLPQSSSTVTPIAVSNDNEEEGEIEVAVPRIAKDTAGENSEKEYQGYQAEKSWAGFNLYPESGTAKVHLVNMTGTSLHQWNFDAARARMLPNCNLLVVHGSKWGLDRAPWRQLRHNVREYDWEGNVVWEYITPGPAHHDVHRLDNGNTLLMYRRELTEEEKTSITDPDKKGSEIRTDIILEVTPAGEIVWEWAAHEHLDLNSCGSKPCRKLPKVVTSGKKVFDWTHSNTIAPIPENKWYDQGDKRFKPGNIVFMPRNMWQAMIIDKESKEIIWKYSGDYKGGLSGGHEPHMIPKGYPGAGNVLIFDNGRSRGFSVVLEINPTTNEVVWVYDVGGDLYSQAAGSMQRLPNGNTLISEDVGGRVFEVTPDKEIVWQYTGNEFRSCRAQRYPQNACNKLADYPLN
ncbi:MAG: aryl-sulfate sulfotransferase [Bdellovibrionales bacterium]|nr:aryl-sulfate sulfotransferase [Bdellovibrionales bacterium]